MEKPEQEKQPEKVEDTLSEGEMAFIFDRRKSYPQNNALTLVALCFPDRLHQEICESANELTETISQSDLQIREDFMSIVACETEEDKIYAAALGKALDEKFSDWREIFFDQNGKTKKP